MTVFNVTLKDKDYVIKSFDKMRNVKAIKLKRLLAKVPAWEREITRLEDTTPLALLKERLALLEKLSKEEGLSYNKQGTLSYSKGAVTFDDLRSRICTHQDGSVSLDVYVPRSKYGAYRSPSDRVLRIFVGDTTRITNTILQHLLKKV